MRIRFSFGSWCLVCVLVATSAAVGQTLNSSPRFPVYLNNKYGYINERGQVVIRPRFERVMSFSEGLAAVLENSHWKYIDESGKVVIAVPGGRQKCSSSDHVNMTSDNPATCFKLYDVDKRHIAL